MATQIGENSIISECDLNAEQFRTQKNLLPNNGSLFLVNHFISLDRAWSLFDAINSGTHWRAEEIMIFGKKRLQPRLISWQAEPGLSYQYSGLTLKPEGFSPMVFEVKREVEALWQVPFNSVLLNLYRDGQDSNGWHSDDEKELGTNPLIASVSLGEPRDFMLKHRTTGHKIKILLEHGSCLLMGGEMQKYWLHTLPKRKRVDKPRINLTFRRIQKKD
ncbi:MAG: alpha-ketoglutarate-dependent dioxygenase AlkB [Pseudomonadota bacterium]